MESLPKQFVAAMRTLFDIMDDKQSGLVKVTDIENRWRDDRTKGLPRGVVESLQKVASHDGLLTFERFCTGLKICLLRNQVENASNTNRNDDIINPINKQILRPPSVPLLDVVDDVNKNREQNWKILKNVDSSTQNRPNGMPQIPNRKDNQIDHTRYLNTTSGLIKSEGPNIPYGPPKPPRLEKVTSDKNLENPRPNYKSEISSYDNENMPVLKTEVEALPLTPEVERGRGNGDGRSSNEIQSQLNSRRINRRREPRRHTLHNGVDYNLLKRMKLIEQEKDLLLQGLSAVEEAREWYLKQLSEVQEKMRYTGRMGAYVEPWSEAQQERLELLKARVHELNRQLGALATGWRHGPLSLHMNLVLPSVTAGPASRAIAASNHAAVLRSQNLLLTDEVNRKTERISVLEREKSTLTREMLLQRNRNKIENFT